MHLQNFKKLQSRKSGEKSPVAGYSYSLCEWRICTPSRWCLSIPTTLTANVHRRICSANARGKSKGHPSQQKRTPVWVPFQFYVLLKMAGNSASLRDSHALRLVSELPDLRAANVHRRICSANARGKSKGHPSQHKRHPCGCLLCWLGWPDLNRRMPESKSGALPLGDIPKCRRYYNILLSVCQDFFTFIIYY